MNQNSLLNIAKKPIIGEIIIFFTIYLTLGAISGALNHFDLKGEDKQLLFTSYMLIALIYVIGSLSFRMIKIFYNQKDTKG